MSRVSRLCPVFRAQPGACPPETQKPDVAPPCGRTGNSTRAQHSGFGRKRKCGKRGKHRNGQNQTILDAAARKQEKAKVSCAHLGEHICPQCGQFGAFTQGLLRGQKKAPLGSEAQIITLFQGKQRGHTQNWREISMANRKIKFPLWLMPETKATVERL